jgi:hypothetical protein
MSTDELALELALLPMRCAHVGAGRGHAVEVAVDVLAPPARHDLNWLWNRRCCWPKRPRGRRARERKNA